MKLSLFLSAITATAVLAQDTSGEYCVDKVKICVHASKVGSSIKWTVNSMSNGWVGFGIGGPDMKDADLFVGWKNSTGGATVTFRKATENAYPETSGGEVVRADPAYKKPGATFTFAFIRPAAGITNKHNYLFATSDKAPEKPDDPTSSFSIHTEDSHPTGIDLISKAPEAPAGPSPSGPPSGLTAGPSNVTTESYPVLGSSPVGKGDTSVPKTPKKKCQPKASG